MSKTLTKFDTSVRSAITEAIKDCLQAEDYSVYDEFVDYLAKKIHQAAGPFIASPSKETSNTTKASSSGKTTKSGAPRKVSAYTQWVKLASSISKGADEPAAYEQFTAVENFNSGSGSAQKYSDYELDLVGKTMSVKELLATLKDSLPDEKTMSIAAMGWGLMPKEFRESLVA